MNRYLEKIAKRFDLSWKAQALDNLGDVIVRGRVSDWSTPEGAAKAREAHKVFRQMEHGFTGQHGSVEVTRHKGRYLVRHLDGVRDGAGRHSPIVGYSNRRLSPEHAERLMRHASASRHKIESARGMSPGIFTHDTFKGDYVKAMSHADRKWRYHMYRRVGVPAAGAAALLGAAGYVSHLYNKNHTKQDN